MTPEQQSLRAEIVRGRLSIDQCEDALKRAASNKNVMPCAKRG